MGKAAQNQAEQGSGTIDMVASAENAAKRPRTSRGRATQNKLLDAAAKEFGEKGFHEASVSSITRRAGTALGSFYTYFDSKDEIFRALVQHMSTSVGRHAASAMGDTKDALERERKALEGFLAFTRANKEIYRIIDEAEFVDPASYRQHYERIASRIAQRLEDGSAAGSLRNGPDDALGELEAWAIMGMNVFLGLRYGVWDDGNSDIAEVAARANQLLRKGLARR